LILKNTDDTYRHSIYSLMNRNSLLIVPRTILKKKYNLLSTKINSWPLYTWKTMQMRKRN